MTDEEDLAETFHNIRLLTRAEPGTRGVVWSNRGVQLVGHDCGRCGHSTHELCTDPYRVPRRLEQYRCRTTGCACTGWRC